MLMSSQEKKPFPWPFFVYLLYFRAFRTFLSLFFVIFSLFLAVRRKNESDEETCAAMGHVFMLLTPCHEQNLPFT